MANYLIGDVQGCDEALGRLLQKLDFSPSRDTLWLLGDLINRGPDSAAVLRRLMALGDAAQCLLGNHDLSFLAVAHGVRAPGRRDTLDDLLAAPDRPALVDWLRHRSMARCEHGVLMVHAGVLPQWSVAQTLALAGELERVLRGPELLEFLPLMYGSTPAAWRDTLQVADRLRVIVNALTRIRYCTPEGEMDLRETGAPGSAPTGLVPWFDLPDRQTADTPIAFGHWSTLGLVQRPDLIALDTGCVWGGCLSALRLGAGPTGHEVIQVGCPQAQPPGE